MKTPTRLTRDLLTGLTCVLLAGCATVDPKRDYSAVTQHVTEATGQSNAYRPDQEDAVESRVEALLADGLTADEAVQVCLLNNPGFQAAWMDVGMAKADLVQSGLLSNPSLGGSLRFPSGGGLANLEFGIAQNIAELWQIPVRQRVAQAALDEAILRLARQAAELAADARAAYVRATGAQELHKVALDNLAIARQLLDLALVRQQAGAGAELDVNLSRAAVLEAELAVESARLTASEARRSLAQLLGLSIDAETIELSGPFPPSSPELPPAEDLITVAREKRLDIRAAMQAVAQADARIAQERANLFPRLDVGVALERGERRSDDPSDGTDLIIGPSLGLEVPVFDQNQAQIAKAQYARQQAEKALASTNQRMTQEVRGASDQMATAWRIVNAYRDQFVPLAQSNLDLSRESYKAGRASFLSVLESQRFFLDTRRRSIEAIQTAAAAVPELERAVGIPMSDLSSTQPAASEPARGTQP